MLTALVAAVAPALVGCTAHAQFGGDPATPPRPPLPRRPLSRP